MTLVSRRYDYAVHFEEFRYIYEIAMQHWEWKMNANNHPAAPMNDIRRMEK